MAVPGGSFLLGGVGVVGGFYATSVSVVPDGFSKGGFVAVEAADVEEVVGGFLVVLGLNFSVAAMEFFDGGYEVAAKALVGGVGDEVDEGGVAGAGEAMVEVVDFDGGVVSVVEFFPSGVVPAPVDSVVDDAEVLVVEVVQVLVGSDPDLGVDGFHAGSVYVCVDAFGGRFRREGEGEFRVSRALFLGGGDVRHGCLNRTRRCDRVRLFDSFL